ncbi:hypothetical protein Tco_0369878 [Tanacetum coccineum]
MRTRSQSRNLHNQQHQAPPPVVEPFNLEEPLKIHLPTPPPMEDQRTMAHFLEAHHRAGYEEPSNYGQTMKNQLKSSTDMLSKFVTSNTASTSGTLPSNTVTNPKEDLKGITTRSGVLTRDPTDSLLLLL